MTTFDPAQALTVTENALRQLMRTAYPQRYGESWLQRVATQDQRDAWRERQAAELSRRKGLAHLPHRELDYSELWELIEMMKMHWEPLSSALGRKASAIPLLETFERLRNTVGHSRELLAFEQELLSGIAGLIRNQVTISLSAIDPIDEYYPRIESITDSFGNSLDEKRSRSRAGDIAGSVDSGLILHPGEVVEFSCAGIDPQGRDLEWTMIVQHKARVQAVSASAVDAHFRWIVEDGDVGEYVVVTFEMIAVGAKYHRSNGRDQRGWLEYKVRPDDHP